MAQIDTFPRERDLDPDGARAEFERMIGEPVTGDWFIGKPKCWWCGCPKSAYVSGRCPNPDCNEEE